MKNSILRKLSAVTLAAVTAIGASQTVLADVIKIDKDEFIKNSRYYSQEFTFIDLKSAANRGFADEAAGDGKGGWSDQGPANDMSIFNNYGVQKFSGIEFDIIDPDAKDMRNGIARAPTEREKSWIATIERFYKKHQLKDLYDNGYCLIYFWEWYNESTFDNHFSSL